jgi:predicted nucleic acid-binding protein
VRTTERVVLDAGAVLAFLENEAGAEDIDNLLKRGEVWMNLVNLGEVVYIVERERGVGHADGVFAELTSHDPVDGRPPIQWLSVDERLVRQAARVKARGRLSYADSFAAATAQLLGCPVVVCRDDEEFKVAESLGVLVHWIA